MASVHRGAVSATNKLQSDGKDKFQLQTEVPIPVSTLTKLNSFPYFRYYSTAMLLVSLYRTSVGSELSIEIKFTYRSDEVGSGFFYQMHHTMKFEVI